MTTQARISIIWSSDDFYRNNPRKRSVIEGLLRWDAKTDYYVLTYGATVAYNIHRAGTVTPNRPDPNEHITVRYYNDAGLIPEDAEHIYMTDSAVDAIVGAMT